MCSMGSESSTWPKSWERVASGRVLPLRVTRALSSMAERIRGWGGLMLACAEQNTRPDDNMTRAPKLRLFLDIWTSLGEYLRLGNTSRPRQVRAGNQRRLGVPSFLKVVPRPRRSQIGRASCRERE